MRKILFFLTMLFVLNGCSKESETTFPNYGCVYGTNSNNTEVFLGCWHQEIYAAGSNQASADAVADRLGIPRVSVAAVRHHTNVRFERNDKCDCE